MLEYEERFLLQKGGQVLAQGMEGVTDPPGVPDLWGCGVEGHSQCAQWGGLGSDSVILEVFSKLNDSMVL